MINEQAQGQNNNKNNEWKGRGLFYGVIAVATFIIMAVGATFAYFTATTSSTNSAVQTGSTTLQLKFISYGSGWMHNDLIPADTTVVEYSFENQNDTTVTDETDLSNTLCKDDFGNSICSVYVFQVYNGANSPQSVSISIISETNGFASLNAMAYELAIPTDSGQLEIYNSTDNNNGRGDPAFREVVANGDDPDDLIDVVDGNGILMIKGDDIKANQYSPVFANRKGVVKTLLKYNSDSSTKVPAMDRLLVNVNSDNEFSDASERTTVVASDITINGGTTKTFALVLYIKNANLDQTDTDAAKEFYGQVVVGSGDGSSGVSGTISALVESQLQSNTQSSGDQGSGTGEPDSGSGSGTNP